MKKNAFTILELLVVLAVMGVFTAIAYPNISNWIADRNVKKEVYETVAFIKERKAEVTSGKYGMVQVLLNDQLEVFTMSPEKFFQIYKVSARHILLINRPLLVVFQIRLGLQLSQNIQVTILE